jgi:hypothetical protein
MRVKLTAWLLAAYALAVAAVVFTPSPVDRPLREDLDRIIQELHESGVPQFIGYGDIEFLSNVVMFVPIGFLLALVLPRRTWALAIVAGPLLSGAIEATQLLVLPERYATLQDVVANGIGSLCGAIVAVILRMLASHRDRLVLEDVMEGRRSS